jgi:CRP-like cAMP-binding protein
LLKKLQDSLIYSHLMLVNLYIQLTTPALYLYSILDGTVDLSMIHNEGYERRFVCLEKGDTFGIGEIFLDNYYLNAYTVEHSTLLRIKREAFIEYVLPIKEINLKVIRDFAMMTKINSMLPNWYKTRERILLYLSNHVNDFKYQKTILLDREINVTSIANRLGVSREHISRVIKSLVLEGILSKKGHQLIVNREKLVTELQFSDFSGEIKF